MNYAFLRCGIAASMFSLFCSYTFAQSQLVRFDSIIGKFDVELFDNTPLTRDNFLDYVDAGDYNNTFFHRSALTIFGAPFVLQGGGFRFDGNQLLDVVERPRVNNEPFNSNVRGTIAMAKLGPPAPDPANSATNQWFFNLGDNSANLDNQNGGFTAFGQVQGDGMLLVDLLSTVPTFDLRARTNISAFGEIPLVNFSGEPDAPILVSNFLLFNQIVRATNALGDLDGSGSISGADIDLLYAAYGPTPANDIDFDIDSTGVIGNGDRDRLIQSIAGTRLGDLNFDQRVDVLGDAFTLVSNLNRADEATYAQGDINGDGRVDVLGDAFVLVSNIGFNGATSAAPTASSVSVPEPSMFSVFSIFGAVVLFARRQRLACG